MFRMRRLRPVKMSDGGAAGGTGGFPIYDWGLEILY